MKTTFSEELKHKIAGFALALEKQQADRLKADGMTEALIQQNAQVKVTYRKKYCCVDIGGSGRYLVDMDGNIWGIKAYGVIHRGHQYGTVELESLNQWDWSGYYARPHNVAPAKPLMRVISETVTTKTQSFLEPVPVVTHKGPLTSLEERGPDYSKVAKAELRARMIAGKTTEEDVIAMFKDLRRANWAEKEPGLWIDPVTWVSYNSTVMAWKVLDQRETGHPWGQAEVTPALGLELDKGHPQIERNISPPMSRAITLPVGDTGILVYVAVGAFCPKLVSDKLLKDVAQRLTLEKP